MSTYFVWTTRRHVDRTLAAKIDNAIKAVAPSASFVRHYAAGNETHGWIERDNDGMNDANFRRKENEELIRIAVNMLGV